MIGLFDLQWSLEEEPSHARWRTFYAALAARLPDSEFAREYLPYAKRNFPDAAPRPGDGP